MNRSSFPSPLKSTNESKMDASTALETIPAANVPSPFPMYVVLPVSTSAFPSPFRSPTTKAETGAAMLVVLAAAKVPSPFPRRTESWLSGPATRMSGFPSPLKSATANWCAVKVGDDVDLHAVPVVNVPSPLPSRTVPSKKSRSGFPSPFTSAVRAWPLPENVGGVKKGFAPWHKALEEARRKRKVKTTQAGTTVRRNVRTMIFLHWPTFCGMFSRRLRSLRKSTRKIALVNQVIYYHIYFLSSNRKRQPVPLPQRFKAEGMTFAVRPVSDVEAIEP
jgi:hypothetical protein